MLPHIETFDRANGNLGADWINANGVGTWQIESNKARCVPSGGGGGAFPLAFFYRDFENIAYGPDYQVKAKITKPTTADSLTIGVVGRAIYNGTIYSGYVALVRQFAAAGEQIQLYIFNNADPASGGFTQLGSTVTEEWTDGDTLILRMQGNQISVYRDSGSGPVLKIGPITDNTLNDVSGTMGIRGTGNGLVDDLTMEFIPSVKNLVNLQIGAVTPSTARIAFMVSEAAAVKVEYSTDIAFGTSTITPALSVASDTDFTGKIDLTGLAADTQYYFRVKVDDVVKNVDTAATPMPRFKTFPAYGNVSFSFIVGSCLETINRPSFDLNNGEANLAQIIAKSFRFWHCGGDNYYSDYAPSAAALGTLAAFRSRARMALTVGLVHRSAKKLMTQWPTYRMWDDHEVTNDWNPVDNASLMPNAAQAFDEHVGRCNPDGYRAGVRYYAFEYGNVGFFSTDGRSFRSRQADADGPNKTCLGATQLADLKAWLETNDNRYRIKFIINSTPINGHTTTGNDAFGVGYAVELKKLLDFIRARRIKGVVFLSSDQHWCGAFRRISDSNGPSDGIGFYEFQATPYSAFVLTMTADTTTDILFKDQSTAANHGVITVNTTLADATVQFQMFNQANTQLGTVTITESQINQAPVKRGVFQVKPDWQMLFPADQAWKAGWVHNLSNVPIYIQITREDTQLTAANGIPILAGEKFNLPENKAGAAIKVIHASTGDKEIRYALE